MRCDGKFMVGNDIPEGQGSVTSLLSECFELTHDLRDHAEHAADQGSKDTPQPGSKDTAQAA